MHQVIWNLPLEDLDPKMAFYREQFLQPRYGIIV